MTNNSERQDPERESEQTMLLHYLPMPNYWSRNAIISQITIPHIQLQTSTPSIQCVRIHVDTRVGRELISCQICVVTRVYPVFRDWSIHGIGSKLLPLRIKGIIFFGVEVCFESILVNPRWIPGTGFSGNVWQLQCIESMKQPMYIIRGGVYFPLNLTHELFQKGNFGNVHAWFPIFHKLSKHLIPIHIDWFYDP